MNGAQMCDVLKHSGISKPLYYFFFVLNKDLISMEHGCL